MKKVSIIVPAYKCAGFISKCLDVLTNQTYPNVEVIVINDGSPDNLAEVLEGYEGRIRVITKKNGGVASARNAGLDAASGDYISFVDSDDGIDTDTIEKAVKLMESSNADIVRFNIIREYPDGTCLPYTRIFDGSTVIEKYEYPKRVYVPMMEGISFNHPSGLIKRELIGDTRFDETMITCEDAAFNLPVLTRSERMVYDPTIVYHYYQSGEGLTGNSISVKDKYACNYKFGKYMTALLPEWGMNTPYYRMKILMRLVNITVSKVIRKK